MSDIKSCRYCKRYRKDAWCKNCHFEPKDMVEVVRCRDCRNAFNIESEWLCGMAGLNVGIKPDDFCSYGERREP